MNRDLYLRLIKLWHPDKTQNPHTKKHYEEMSKAINNAYAGGDMETLQAIDTYGDEYLSHTYRRRTQPPYSQEQKPHHESAHTSYARETNYQNDAGSQYANKTRRGAEHLVSVDFQKGLICLSPLFLPFHVSEWQNSSKLVNLLSIVSGVAWLYALWMFWGQLNGLESAARMAGYSHEGLLGLLFVLVRGGVIVTAIPIAIALAIVMFIGAICLALIGGGSWILGGILGFFHPWLAILSYIIGGYLLLVAAWRSIGDEVY